MAKKWLHNLWTDTNSILLYDIVQKCIIQKVEMGEMQNKILFLKTV